jgi:hypothetical protein
MPNQRAHRLPRAAAAASSDTMMVYELAKRSHDGLVVRLLRDPLRDQVVLRYRDLRTARSSRRVSRTSGRSMLSIIRTPTVSLARRRTPELQPLVSVSV